jgi:hypothetical protein
MKILQNLTTHIDLETVKKYMRQDRHRGAQRVQRLIDQAKTLNLFSDRGVFFQLPAMPAGKMPGQESTL